MSSGPRIAIVGAGPGGLTLAVLLHNRGIAATVFELRPQLTDEQLDQPSGSLDLHEESGLTALKEAGLYEEFLTLTGDCTESQRIADRTGAVLYEDDGGERNRPEVARHKIVKLLLSHLPASAISWGHKLASARRVAAAAGGTEIELDFGAHGTRAFDLVVGADGAWSRVRALLTDRAPRYAGVHTVTLDIRHLAARHPQLAAYVGDGTFMALGDCHGVASQRSVHGSARIYVFATTADEGFAAAAGLAGATPAQVKQRLLGDGGLLSGWGPAVKELLAAACDDEEAHAPGAPVDVKALYTLPPGHQWVHQPGATLLGDAAHLSNPPAGEGVNIAMLDAAKLARAVVAAHNTAGQDAAAFAGALDPLVQEFEADMAVRAKEVADMSAMVSDLMFGANGAQVMTDWFNKMMEEAGQAHSIKEQPAAA